MAISIYYTARRQAPLRDDEWREIRRLVDRYSVRDAVRQHHRTGRGWSGEDFSLYEPSSTSHRTILDGATRLSDDSDSEFWVSARHWCRLLTELRRLLHDADWTVHIDGRDVPWNVVRAEYTPEG